MGATAAAQVSAIASTLHLVGAPTSRGLCYQRFRNTATCPRCSLRRLGTIQRNRAQERQWLAGGDRVRLGGFRHSDRRPGARSGVGVSAADVTPLEWSLARANRWRGLGGNWYGHRNYDSDGRDRTVLRGSTSRIRCVLVWFFVRVYFASLFVPTGRVPKPF